MGYQTFTQEEGGDSNSISKLARIGLPQDLTGKAFLDIGCNEGFFCQEAKKRNAARVVGVDSCAPYIERAKERAKNENLDIEFFNTHAYALPEGKFDVIILLSSVQYIDSPARLFRLLHEKLNPGGLFILECGILPGLRPFLQRLYREDRDFFYPTFGLLRDNWLADFEISVHGASVSQGGDPVRRFVIHCWKETQVSFLLDGLTSSLSLRGTRHHLIDLDQMLFPNMPRKIHIVPDVQQKMVSTFLENNQDVEKTWPLLRTEAVFEYASQCLADVIAKHRWDGQIIVEGFALSDIYERTIEKLKNFPEITCQVIQKQSKHHRDVNSPYSRYAMRILDGTESAAILKKESSSPCVSSSGVPPTANSQIALWVDRFLRHTPQPNLVLADRLLETDPMWVGPIEVGENSLITVAGPGKKYHEDPKVWQSRIDKIKQDGLIAEDLPPLLVYLREKEAKESGGPSYELLVADGAHRLEALRQLGKQKIWCYIWFHTVQSQEVFLREYAKRLYD